MAILNNNNNNEEIRDETKFIYLMKDRNWEQNVQNKNKKKGTQIWEGLGGH